MLKHFLYSILVLGACSVFGGNIHKPLEIVRDGKSKFTIVLPQKPTEADHRAAQLFQSYVLKMTGCELPVQSVLNPSRGNMVFINPSDNRINQKYANYRKLLKEDGFLIATDAKNVTILSGGRKGSVYGVLNLLEKQFGCRKYSPTVEKIPHFDVLKLNPQLDLQNPVNSFRVVYGELAKDLDYRDWQRMNVVDEVFGTGFYVHTFNKMVPWEKYFSSHPEYYSWVGGKRIIDQLCLSNPDVYQIVIARLKEAMALEPDKKIWSVSQNDNFSFCHCPECSKIIAEEGSPSGPIIRFVNSVAKEFPDKVISTLAYQYSRQAPKVTKPADNVQIMLCTIELNRSKPIAEDPTSASFVKDIVDWGKISKHIYLWDYTVNFSHHISPFPNLHVLQPNIQFFVKNGALEHFQQTNTSPGHEFSELKSYLIARLLWNPNVNIDSVKTDFLNGYYGAAGPLIGKYIQHLESEIQKTGEWLDIYGHPVTHANTFLSADNMKTYVGLFDEAEQEVKDQPALLERVKTARLPIQYAAMEIGKNDMFGPRGFYQEINGNFLLRPEMKQMIEDFYATCVRNNVNTVNEAGLTPGEYYKASLRFVDVQVAGNLAFRKTVKANPAPSPQYNGGDLKTLTDGVQGASDYKVHWLGWEGTDFELLLDLGAVTEPKEIEVSTLYFPKSWILHPKSVSCQVSEDGNSFRDVEKIIVEGDQRKEEVTRQFEFKNELGKCRYIRFQIEGTRQLFDWHPSAGGKSWVFVDEIVVR